MGRQRKVTAERACTKTLKRFVVNDTEALGAAITKIDSSPKANIFSRRLCFRAFECHYKCILFLGVATQVDHPLTKKAKGIGFMVRKNAFTPAVQNKQNVQ